MHSEVVAKNMTLKIMLYAKTYFLSFFFTKTDILAH